MNIQLPEKYAPRTSGTLDVHSVFYTIQGEGPFTGHPAVFIRLAGCNLQCPKCDTNYTEGRQTMTVEALYSKVLELTEHLMNSRTLIVITGGEPLRQQSLKDFLQYLSYMRYFVQIETNGTMPFVQGSFHVSQNPSAKQGVYIVVSPKTSRVQTSIANMACAWKYVASKESLKHSNDGLPMDALGLMGHGVLARNYAAPVYLQAQDDKNEEVNASNMQACIQSCLQHGYIFQLQTHKIMGVE